MTAGTLKSLSYTHADVVLTHLYSTRVGGVAVLLVWSGKGAVFRRSRRRNSQGGLNTPSPGRKLTRDTLVLNLRRVLVLSHPPYLSTARQTDFIPVFLLPVLIFRFRPLFTLTLQSTPYLDFVQSLEAVPFRPLSTATKVTSTLPSVAEQLGRKVAFTTLTRLQPCKLRTVQKCTRLTADPIAPIGLPSVSLSVLPSLHLDLLPSAAL